MRLLYFLCCFLMGLSLFAQQENRDKTEENLPVSIFANGILEWQRPYTGSAGLKNLDGRHLNIAELSYLNRDKLTINYRNLGKSVPFDILNDRYKNAQLYKMQTDSYRFIWEMWDTSIHREAVQGQRK